MSYYEWWAWKVDRNDLYYEEYVTRDRNSDCCVESEEDLKALLEECVHIHVDGTTYPAYTKKHIKRIVKEYTIRRKNYERKIKNKQKRNNRLEITIKEMVRG